MGSGNANAPGSLGTPYYFRSLETLHEQYRDQIVNFQWLDKSVLGGKLDAAIVFIDLSNFSGMCAAFPDKPHAAAFLGHHFLSLVENWSVSTLRERINTIYIDKVVGDAVLLVIPGSEANAMTKAMLVSVIVMQIPIYESKIGVQWGTVWLGDVGLEVRNNRVEPYKCVTVMGHNVNIAARLVGKAQKGQLLMLEERRKPDLDSQFAKWKCSSDSIPLKGVLSSDAKADILRLSIQPNLQLFPDGMPEQFTDPAAVVRDYLERFDSVPQLRQSEHKQ